jgi:hypothetical protein
LRHRSSGWRRWLPDTHRGLWASSEWKYLRTGLQHVMILERPSLRRYIVMLTSIQIAVIICWGHSAIARELCWIGSFGRGPKSFQLKKHRVKIFHSEFNSIFSNQKIDRLSLLDNYILNQMFITIVEIFLLHSNLRYHIHIPKSVSKILIKAIKIWRHLYNWREMCEQILQIWVHNNQILVSKTILKNIGSKKILKGKISTIIWRFYL